jgi:hypothetical protein
MQKLPGLVLERDRSPEFLQGSQFQIIAIAYEVFFKDRSIWRNPCIASHEMEVRMDCLAEFISAVPAVRGSSDA